MIILVEGYPALIKSGSSFEFIAENRLFMGRDSYTLTLTFPLRDCPQNRAIFGNLERIDVAKEKVFYECIIHDKSFSAVGSLLVTGVSDTEVKCQFAEGRCEQTATDPFEDKYINQLDLGTPPTSGSYLPTEAWQGINYGQEEVALPWINESYPTQFNNWVVYDDGYKWASRTDSTTNGGRVGSSSESLAATSLSWQPYLIVIAKRICKAVGYTYDFQEWEDSDYIYLLICNTLPWSWDCGYKDVLPHWTVTEFFSKLELLLMCEFNIDHKSKHISFEFSKTALSKIDPVEITDVVEEYDSEIATDNQSCDYIGAKRLMYKECDHAMQPYYACDWFLQDKEVYTYSSVNEMIEKTKKRVETSNRGYPIVYYGEDVERTTQRGSAYSTNAGSVYYVPSVDTYFVLRSIGRYLLYTDSFDYNRYAQICVLQPINMFGSGSVESDDVDNEEIEFVPVCVCDTYVSDDDDQGYMMYLSFSSMEDESSDDTRTDLTDKDYGNKIVQYSSASQIEAGNEDKASEYYDVIYVGFWDGAIPVYGKTPYPMLDSVNVTQDWTYFSNHLQDLRLSSSSRNIQSQIPSINPKQKFKFSFISDTIPNPRAIFYIHGQKFLCEKITATFTEDGMSQLLKGEFYPII